MTSEEIVLEQTQEESYSLQENLEFWQNRLERMETEIEQHLGSKEFPEWWYEDSSRLWKLKDQLHEFGPDANNVGRYLEYMQREAVIKEKMGWGASTDALDQTIYNLDSDFVGKSFAQEKLDGPMHTAMLDYFQNEKNSKEVVTSELETLKIAYGLSSITELLGIKGDEFSERIQTLLLTENVIKWIQFNDSGYDTELSYAENKERNLEWMTKVVTVISGLSPEIAYNYVFSASQQIDAEITLKIIKIFEHFGAERIQAISNFTGIYGLEGYSVEQLERMERLASDPEDTAAMLKEHDVVVMMVNRVGDHNGVMRNAANEFDDETGRVLFFEINRLEDIYRRMATLRKVGIQPSTLVLSAHSSPGRFVVSDERDKAAKRIDIATIAGRRLVHLANGTDLEMKAAGAKGYSMHGMNGFTRLVDDYMQASRSIDDSAEDFGRKKIIFQACYAGRVIDQNDKDTNYQQIKIGEESIVSQLGKDLIRSGTTSNIDIYGGPDGIQMHRTKDGVRYSGAPEVDEVTGDFARTQLDAIRIRVENGKLSQVQVNEIPLRKSNSKEVE